MKRYFIYLLLWTLSANLLGQNTVLPSVERNSKAQWSQSLENSILSKIPVENIGPTIFNGRVTDLDVNPQDPTEFFVAYASGGLWYTANNGTTFTPLFQQESVMTIGDIAVDWKTGTVYVGTGEQNSSRSSYAGNGMYKSTDKGKTWSHLGLDESHHISKVIIHPTNNKIVWVAALGHLYSKNKERGIYKSLDGGKTWSLTLQVDNITGASELIIHPTNPNILYAAMWEKSRSAWDFLESGKGSGIYKSTDGGNKWTLLTKEKSGFISGEGTGRIGLDIAIKNGKEYLYAVVDNYNRRPKQEEAEKKGISTDSLKTMRKADFLKLKEDDINNYLKSNGFPSKYTAKTIIEMVENDKIKVSDIATYNDNPSVPSTETPVIGAEVYLSLDQGKTWKKTHEGYIDDLYSSYGYYFGQIRAHPNYPEKVYIYGVPILGSNDGGKTWKNLDSENVHSDHHSLWVNPNRKGHLINGNDGGVNISYDDGSSWMKCTHPEVGQFYYINVDNAEPYNVYGGVQDNGVWMGSHVYKNTSRWQSSGDYPYKAIMGGDGMQVQIDSRDNNVIYTGLQFGTYFRLHKTKKERTYITPKHDVGKKPYRWNWQTPILLSPHNQDIFYMGSNMLLRSMNQGKDFTEISNDLTHGAKIGDVPFGTLTTLDESKLKFGLIYTGSDDGMVHVTNDGGNTWSNISAGLPAGLWVTRIQASAFDEGTVYVCLNGYRNDHFKPYVYKSLDYGKTWENIVANLPNEPVNVIKEDPLDKFILYVGTDHGLYVSMDMGQSYINFGGSLPRVAVHDVVVQPKAKHLLIGTHGRSIYKADISNLKEIREKLSESLLVFKPEDLRYSERYGRKTNVYTEVLVPKIKFETYSDKNKSATIEVLTSDDAVIISTQMQLPKGLSPQTFDGKVDMDKHENYLKAIGKSDWVKKNGSLKKADDGNYYLIPGKYQIKVSSGDKTSKVDLIIK